MKNVYFATLPNGYFGSAVNSWNTLNVEKLAVPFLEEGFNINYISITDISNINFDNDDILIYTSFFQEEIRSYLKDVLFYVKDKCLIVPPYDILLAHENKGFQEIVRREKNINTLGSAYLFDVDQLECKFPYVFKTVDGSGSKGVELVNNVKDIKNIRKNYFNISPPRKIKNIIRLYQLPSENYKLYQYYYKPFKRFITQDFIENLTCDYRVLVIGDRFYAMRRDVRDGDFRASGSKKFHYDEVPCEVLDYAKKVFEKLNSPYISMDLVYKEKDVYLIEYQGTNFGSSVLRNSQGYYEFNNNQWFFKKALSKHEETLAYGLFFFVKHLK